MATGDNGLARRSDRKSGARVAVAVGCALALGAAGNLAQAATQNAPATYEDAVRQYLHLTDGRETADAVAAGLQGLEAQARASGRPLREWFFQEARFGGQRIRPDTAQPGLTEVLDQRRGPCLSLASLYLSLAERLEIDATPVATPRHVFIREATDDGGHRNVELLEGGRHRPDDSYLAQEKAPRDDPRAASLLRPLSPAQFLAYLLNNHAVGLRAAGETKATAATYKRALDLDPDCQPCLYNYANLLADQGKVKKARRLYDRALELHPWDEEAGRNRGSIFAGGAAR